jgi:outer membrane protein insertion porin family
MCIDMRIHVLLALLLLVGVPGFGAEQQYENRLVERLEVRLATQQPGEAIDEEALLGRMKTRQGDVFSETDFDADLKMLARDFYRIEPDLKVVSGQLRILLNLWPKPIIRSITWEGNQAFPAFKLQEELGIPIQSAFDRHNFSSQFREVQAYYVKKGYFEARLSFDADLDEESNQVDIRITVDEGRAGWIDEIRFTDFTKEEEDDLVGMVYSTKYFFLMSWATGAGTYRQEAVEQDQLTARTYLQNRGYADAQVEIVVHELEGKHKVVLEFVATKGEIYMTGKQTFSGHTLFSDKEIDALFAVRKGEPFSPDKVRQTSQSIMDLYGDQGYIDTFVTYEPQLDPTTREYTVHYTIREGKQYRVGLIKIFGNTWTDATVILHETLVTPGDVFSSLKLKATEQRLQNIGYFENVNVYAVSSNELEELDGTFRDIHIEVEEKGTGAFGFSFGYSTTEHIFGGLNLTERNFRLSGLPHLFSDGYTKALRGGGEYLHFQTTIGQRANSYTASWTKPYVCDTDWSLGIDVERVANRYQADYDVETLGLTIHTSYPINAFVRGGGYYRIAHTDITIPAKAPARLKAEASNNGLISSIGASLTYDSRNHPMEPSQGFYSRLGTEYTGLGGKHCFFKAEYLNSYYASLMENFIMKIRCDARFIFPIGDTTFSSLPIGARFFLGGEDSVRGYKNGAIGPLYTNGDPRGGITQTLVSTEYLYRLHERVGLFTFVEGGSNSNSELCFDHFSGTWGYGIRIRPIDQLPPIVIGQGHPIREKDKDRTKKFFITLGARF